MSNRGTTSIGALVVAGLALLIALFAAFSPDLQESADGHEPGEYGDESDLLGTMIRLQRYYEKAGAAADAGNWPLASFYAHELEETAEHVAEAGWVDDGVELGPLAQQHALPAADSLHSAAESGDAVAFDTAQLRMAAACNVCHRQTDHAFLEIRPASGAAATYPSQVFAPEAPTE